MPQDTITRSDDRGALPGVYSWLDGDQTFVVCAFYTSNYLPQALALKASLEKHRINHYLRLYERRASWEATTRLKPHFICHCLETFPDRDVLYLDADSILRQYPTFIGTVTSDVSLILHPARIADKSALRLSAGTVFVRNTPGGRQFANAWRAEDAKAGPYVVDEELLYLAFASMIGVSVTLLPYEYYKVFDHPGRDPIVEHFQASRSQFKRRRLTKRLKALQRLALPLGAAAAGFLAGFWI